MRSLLNTPRYFLGNGSTIPGMHVDLIVFIISLIVGVAGLVGSYILYIALRGIDKSYQQQQLDLRCQGEIDIIYSNLDALLALAQSINEMNNHNPYLLDQQQFSLYMTNTRKNTRLPIDMLQLELIDTPTELVNWVTQHPNITISGINQQSFRKEPIELDNEQYLLVTTCNPCPLSVGIDYYSEANRQEVARRAAVLRRPTVSHPLRTTITSSFGRSVTVLSIFIPRFNQSTGAFEGGVGTSYSTATLFGKTLLEHRFDIFDKPFIETPGFNATDLVYSNSTKFLDQDVILYCGTHFNPMIVPLLVMIFAMIVSLLIPCIVGTSTYLLRKKRRIYRSLMAQEEDLRDAVVQKKTSDETNKLKSAFLANMSHEIRTPINGITGLIDFLLDTKLDPTQLDYAQTIKYSAVTLLAIINDILDFSKIEAGKLDIDPIDFDLVELLHSVARASEPLMVKNSNMLSEEILLPIPLFVKADSNRIRQVLTNLISNAAKFTVRGKIIIRATMDPIDTLTRPDEPGPSTRNPFIPLIYMSIVDSGIGMTPLQVQNLFKPFTQADTSTTRMYGGTGLGLSISKSLSKAMGGDILVTSVVNEGSTFTLSIPYVPGDKSKMILPEEEVLLFGKGLVLIVDDNMVNLRVAEKMVRDLGYTVRTAKDGIEAIEKVEELGDELAIILMDGQMPRLDGYQATKQLRDNGFAKPIIAFTANAMKGELERCISFGMNDLIAKPVDKLDLSRKIYKQLYP